MRRGLLASASILVLGAIGCGDGADLADQPEPAQPISERVEPFNRAIASQECDRYAEFQHSFVRENPEPGGEPTEAECEVMEEPLTALEDAEFDQSAEFGTGAIMQAPRPDDFDAPPRFEYVVTLWLIDSDGEYRVFQHAPTETEQIDAEPIADPLPVAEQFVEATRERDCDAMEPLLDPEGNVVEQASGDTLGACELITEGLFFAPAVRGAPDAELEDFGGTADHAFVGVPTSEEYFTIVLGTVPGKEQDDTEPELLVIDVLPSTITAEDINVIEGEEGARGGAAAGDGG